MRNAVRQVITSMLTVNWSQFEALSALRCAIGVAVPLLIGLAIDQPLVGVFGAAGAVGVGFGSFQGAYRARAAVMLLAAVGMAFSVFIGSLAGHSTAATIVVAALWAFAGGLLVALGNGASYVGLQSIVAVLIAGGYPSNLEGAFGRAALVFGGGLVQTLLIVVIWPLRRFAVERRSLAAAYRSLGAYTSMIPAREALPPEPHTFAGTASPLADPQPFARFGEVFVFQALLDEAERIRASLAAFAIHYERLGQADQSCARTLADLSAQALGEIAAALDDGREPREQPGFSQSLASCVGRLSSGAIVEPLLGHIRAAWRTAGVLTAVPGHLASQREHMAKRPRRQAMREGLITLRAQSDATFDRVPSRAATCSGADTCHGRKQSARTSTRVLAAADDRAGAQARLSRHVRVQYRQGGRHSPGCRRCDSNCLPVRSWPGRADRPRAWVCVGRICFRNGQLRRGQYLHHRLCRVPDDPCRNPGSNRGHG